MLRMLGVRGMTRLVKTLLKVGMEQEARSDEYYISNIGVLPEFQGRGIGSRLMQQAEKICRSHGLKKCSLLVSPHNNGAQRLYERLGYRVERSFRFAFGAGELDNLRMVKCLPQEIPVGH